MAKTENIQVLQLHDYFSIPRPELEDEPIYFKTNEEVYDVLKKIENLPIDRVIENIDMGEVYKGFSKEYLRWKLDENRGILYLVPSKEGAYVYDTTTQIHIPPFKWVSLEYSSLYDGLELNFITEEQYQFRVIFLLGEHVRFITGKLQKHENIQIDVKMLEEIYHLLHVDHFTWYEKSMMIHKMVLGEECDLLKCSKDRPDKVTRWIDKLKDKHWEQLEDYEDEACNCSEFTIEDWVHDKSVFLSTTVQYLLESKKPSFTAKAILMFIAFHYFSDYVNYNRTKGCIRSYARDLYNGSENGLNELLKLGWIEAKEYRDEYQCQDICQRLGYHICVDEYFRFSMKFLNIVNWSPYTY